MFRNPGGKLKVIALVVFIFICTASTIGAIITWVAGNMSYTFWPGFLVFSMGPVYAWLASIGLYAFGQLVASTEEHTYQNDQIVRELKKLNSTVSGQAK